MAKDTKKNKLPQFTSPRGVFVYPKLTEPDYGSKDYPNPDGQYSLKLRMAQSEAEAFVNRKIKHGDEMVSLQSLYDAAMQEAERQFGELKVESRKKLGAVKPNELFTVLYDQDTEEPTGEVEFKFKMKASGEFKSGPKSGQKWSRKPDLFDASGQKMIKLPNIWGGSEGKVSFATRDYFVAGTAAAGLTLMLSGVQIITLVSNGSRSADSHGFGQEEGYGYDPDEATEEQTTGGNTGAAAEGPIAGENDF